MTRTKPVAIAFPSSKSKANKPQSSISSLAAGYKSLFIFFCSLSEIKFFDGCCHRQIFKEKNAVKCVKTKIACIQWLIGPKQKLTTRGYFIGKPSKKDRLLYLRSVNRDMYCKEAIVEKLRN
jgi:hypothetical protein